jgi:hypothetical protein
MIFEFLFSISHILLYPYIVQAVKSYLDTTSTKTILDWPEFDVSDPWDSLTEEEYIEDILENSCEDTGCSDYEPRQFDIFGKQADDHVGHYYWVRGNTKPCIVLKQ